MINRLIYAFSLVGASLAIVGSGALVVATGGLLYLVTFGLACGIAPLAVIGVARS